MVTTLERLLLNTRARANTTSLGALKLLVIEEHPGTVFRALWEALAGRLGRSKLSGVHVERGDEIRLEGDRSSGILDCETDRRASCRERVGTRVVDEGFAGRLKKK